MAFTLKCIFGIFILAGIAFSLYGLREIFGTITFVGNSQERAKATFVGYDQEVVETRSSSPSPNWPGQEDFHDSSSIMSYPRFEYVTKEGQKMQIVEAKAHIVEYFKPGQEVEIVLSPPWNPRLAGFYSLYMRDTCILAIGICFILIPLLLWKGIIPLLDTSAGIALTAKVEEQYAQISASTVGPFTVGSIIKATAFFFTFIVIFTLIAALKPYVTQMHLGFGWGLIESLEQKRFDDARELIAKKKGINTTDEHDQSPLLLALEAGQTELARLLIEAGADVNIKSKMYMTPLRIATQSGNLEMVKILLAKGASPDAPEDEFPPFFYAISKKRDDIAQALIEGGTNLHRSYIDGDYRLTVGDIATLAKKPLLVELIRQRGGSFTKNMKDMP